MKQIQNKIELKIGDKLRYKTWRENSFCIIKQITNVNNFYDFSADYYEDGKEITFKNNPFRFHSDNWYLLEPKIKPKLTYKTFFEKTDV